MYNHYRKLDPSRIRQLKKQGLSNAQIAQRFGVTPGAVYSVLRKITTGKQFEKLVFT